MKKLLLFASAALLGGSSLLAGPRVSELFTAAPAEFSPKADLGMLKSPTRADEEAKYLYFGYAEEVSNAYSFNNVTSGYIYLAFQIPVADQAPYIGSKITGLNITTGSSTNNRNIIMNVDAFVTDNITKAPEKVTSGRLTMSAYAQKEVPLEEAYEITGESPIYVGYRFQYKTGAYYLPVDEVPTNQLTSLIAIVQDLNEAPIFANYAEDIGSLCIQARLEGDNLPENVISISSLACPEYVVPGSPISYQAVVKNMGVNPVNSIELKTSISGNDDYLSTVTLNSPLAVASSTLVDIAGVPNSQTGLFNVSVTPVKANGVDIQNAASVSAACSSYSEGYPRRIVVEEATGNWCQFCTRGMAMMDYLAETYPDWIRIAIHGGSPTEPMLVPGYNNWISTYVPGFPFALVNRAVELEPAGRSETAYVPVNDYYTSFPSYAKVDVEANLNSDDNVVEVTSNSEFSLDADRKYLISYVLVEDHVGKYSQANYYYGATGETAALLGEYANIPSGSKIYFNDVVRAINSYPGLENAFPATVEKNKTYSNSISMPLTYTYGKQPNGKAGTIVDPANARVVAMITDSETGIIINAGEAKISSSGVKGVATDEAQVTVEVADGNIIVNGAESFEVYSLDGRRVAPQAVAPGVYVVKTPSKSVKVLVK
ncbi:MAG: hypothetical protein K2N88_03535 [Muribaculaceae bacterium]|nr:hypothetical protein [Muribaculaceae bacterium]